MSPQFNLHVPHDGDTLIIEFGAAGTPTRAKIVHPDGTIHSEGTSDPPPPPWPDRPDTIVDYDADTGPPDLTMLRVLLVWMLLGGLIGFFFGIVAAKLLPFT